MNNDSNLEVVNKVAEELADLTSIDQNEFNHLVTYHIPNALPVNQGLKYDVAATEVKIQDDIFLAGDYLLNGSLNAAMLSGRRAAEAVAHSLSGTLF